MKTIGVGVDIVKNKRIQSSLKNSNFIDRTFSKTEILISKKFENKTNYFSKRFAAKEAFAKALGTGFRQGLNFKDIQILNNKLGKPSIKLLGKTRIKVNKILKKKKFDIFLSLSDDKPLATATVIISI